MENGGVVELVEHVIPPRWSCKPMCGKPLLQIYVVDDRALLLSRKPCFVQWRTWGEWYLTTSDSHCQWLIETYQTEKTNLRLRADEYLP